MANMKFVPQSENWKKKCNNWALMNGLDQSWLSLSTDFLLRNGSMMDVPIAIKSPKVWATVKIVANTSKRPLVTSLWELKSAMPLVQYGLLLTMNSPKKYLELPIKLRSSTIYLHFKPINWENKLNNFCTKSSKWKSAQRGKEKTTKWELSIQFQESMREISPNKHWKTSKWSTSCPFHEHCLNQIYITSFWIFFVLFWN